jgi:hypothetical protein
MMRPCAKALLAGVLSVLPALGFGIAGKKPVSHYRLQVRIDPARHALEAEAWIQHPPSSRFYLHKGLLIQQVIADGRWVAFHLDASAPPLPYSAGTPVAVDAQDIQQLDIKYRGEIDGVVSGVNMITPDLVELAMYSAWFPLFEGMKEYSFELEADLPRDFLATTNGLLTTQQEKEGRSITGWTSYKPGFDIVFLASPHLHQLEGGMGGLRVEIYYSRLPAQILKSKIDHLVAAMNRLSSLYGPPRVKGVLRIVYSPRSGWGYSRIPLFVVSEERAQHELSRENGEARDFRDNCHEMAHFWWSIADARTPDDWINEGLAEFSAFRITQEQYGQGFAAMRLEEYRQNAARSKTSSSIAETETTSPDREINRYDKATLMFLEAQRRFGVEPLDRLLKALYARHAARGDATTALFLEEARKQMGKDAEAFFREELYRNSPVGAGAGPPP